jgi:response regulator RpfG family c-di-GMP phosphodiesterase
MKAGQRKASGYAGTRAIGADHRAAHPKRPGVAARMSDGPPSMDNVEVRRSFGLSRETERIPVVVCTAMVNDVRDQEGWLTAHAVKIVLKPFTIDDIELAVSKAFELPDLVSDSPASHVQSPAHD